MKHLTYYTFSITLLSLFLLSCKSNDNKLEKTNGDTYNTSSSINEEQRKMNKEYKEFKEYALAEINENDENIEKLRIKINESGKTLDEHRQRRVLDLQEQNKELRDRLNNYAVNTSDWQSFKTKFNADLKDVGDSFTDLFSGSE